MKYDVEFGPRKENTSKDPTLKMRCNIIFERNESSIYTDAGRKRGIEERKLYLNF